MMDVLGIPVVMDASLSPDEWRFEFDARPMYAVKLPRNVVPVEIRARMECEAAITTVTMRFPIWRPLA